MSYIPDNIKDLEEKLQKISGEYIRLDDKEEKRVNKIVGDVLTKVKTIKDEVFQKLYKETRYSGSYYEKLKIENPYEFDINLVLELPIEKDSIIIDTIGTNPGFTKMRVKTDFMFTKNTPESVIKKVKSWIEDGYISRSKLFNWFQSVMWTAFINCENTEEIKVRQAGPAWTLEIGDGEGMICVDLVPVFVFGENKWPPFPVRSVHDTPRKVTKPVEWYVVPKAPNGDSSCYSDNFQWRMSFYVIEKDFMSGLNFMKSVLKLFKHLRDKEDWKMLSSYYIKTFFMWELENQKSDEKFWNKGLAYVFWHMLNMLIECLHKKEITFFWHEDCNLIGHFNSSTLDNMENRLKILRRKLERGLDKLETNYSLADAVNDVFIKRSGLSSLSQQEEVKLSSCGDSLEYQSTYTPTQNVQTSQYRPISEDFYSSESSQQTSSTSWGDIATGVSLAALGVAVVGGFAAMWLNSGTNNNGNNNNNDTNNARRRRLQ